MLVVAAAVAVGLGLFIYSLFVLPQLEPRPSTLDMNGRRQAGSPPTVLLPQAPRDWLRRKAATPAVALRPQGAAVRLGFLDSDNERALRSLSRHLDHLTHVAPVWLTLSGLPPQLEVRPDPEVQKALTGHPIGLVPVLTNLAGERYDPETVEHLLRANAATQQGFAEELRGDLEGLGAQGVLIAWEQVDPTYQAALTEFIGRIQTVLHAGGLELWLSIPVGDDIKAFDLDGLAAHVDRFVATLYYETGEEDPPGPIASLPWFREWLDVLVQYGDPTQWVIGLGAFGYDWAGDDSEMIAFYDVMARAASAQAVDILNADPYDGPSFTYREDATRHTVWFLDATTFRDQQREVLQQGLGGIAIDRLGTEDPAIWDVIDCGKSCDPAQFETLPSGDFIATVGQGDFLQASIAHTPGRRSIQVGADGNWGEHYQTLPRTPTVTRSGAGEANQVAITFDDGPDPAWTPRILDILKQHKVQATFFVMGAKAIAHPGLIRRILAEGHELGNHTFSHPDLQRESAWRVRLELNATQRAIESITGRSTLLFRPPYDADRTPHRVTELEPLIVAQGLGYIPTMASIDPLDWERPSASEILARVKAQRSQGSVLLLHDSGGERGATLAALGPVLDYLRERGDRIVPLHVLLDTSHEAINPAIPAADSASQRVLAGTGLNLLQLLGEGAWGFLVVTSGLLLLRTLFIVGIALVRARRERAAPIPPDFAPPVSVLLAAYNEEKVIAQTLEALLASRYAGPLEVILVDDGSRDRTAEIVAGIAATDGRLQLLRQANTGKAVALQTALAQARHPFIAMLDADTQFLPDTLTELLRPLRDPQVGAVSGNIRVSNTGSWIGRFQALDYLAGFNLDRRAYDVLEAIPVVPGAASAYRAEAITAAGGIQQDTLAEDTDLTLSLHRAGYRIRHTPRAQAVTEAPQSARLLLRQRKRWSFGTLQCLWKHRNLLFATRYRWLGLFVLPSIWFFHLFLVALAPLIDLGLVLALLRGADSSLLGYVLAFMGIDLVLALTACALEGEPLRSAWRVIPMRLLYRPLLSIAVLYALQRALRGSWMGWGVQERRGSQPHLSSKEAM